MVYIQKFPSHLAIYPKYFPNLGNIGCANEDSEESQLELRAPMKETHTHRAIESIRLVRDNIDDVGISRTLLLIDLSAALPEDWSAT